MRAGTVGTNTTAARRTARLVAAPLRAAGGSTIACAAHEPRGCVQPCTLHHQLIQAFACQLAAVCLQAAHDQVAPTKYHVLAGCVLYTHMSVTDIPGRCSVWQGRGLWDLPLIQHSCTFATFHRAATSDHGPDQQAAAIATPCNALCHDLWPTPIVHKQYSTKHKPPRQRH
jgi:hypothetical protein